MKNEKPGIKKPSRNNRPINLKESRKTPGPQWIHYHSIGYSHLPGKEQTSQKIASSGEILEA